MIRVRVTRTGIVGATGLFALSGLAGCAAEPSEDAQSSSEGESGLTVQNPGTGVFELTWSYGTPTGYSFTAKNSTDEYVRAGEAMTFTVPAWFMWQCLHPSDPMPSDPVRLKKLSAKVKAVLVKANGSTTTKTVATTGWQGTQTWDIAATTPSFTIVKGMTAVRFEMTIADADDPTKTASLAQSDFLEVAVIGGTLPDKTLLFDSDYGKLRQRVLEGGNPVAGATLALGYTDWRAAAVIDQSRIDRQIGTATSYGRFGAIEIPVYGELELEITASCGIDGAWQDLALAANAKSRLLPAGGRVDYEASLPVPKTAKALELSFHVKAYLVVDYSKQPNMKWQKYSQGQRILVADKWDNEHGAAFDNYDFATEKK
jgi:hypothetical protein